MVHRRQLHNRLMQCICALWAVAFGWYFFSAPLPNIPVSLFGNSAGDIVIVNRVTLWNAYYPSISDLPNPIDFDVAHSPGVESGVKFLNQRFDYWGPAAILLVLAWSLGAAVFQFVPASYDLLRSERIVIQVGCGLSLFSLWVLGAGCCGTLSTIAIGRSSRSRGCHIVRDWQSQAANCT